MDNQKMLEELTGIFRDVLDVEDVKIAPQTTAADVPEWDSLNHIQLVVAIEKYFKVRFSSQEIQSWKTVGDMCAAISKQRSLSA